MGLKDKYTKNICLRIKIGPSFIGRMERWKGGGRGERLGWMTGDVLEHLIFHPKLRITDHTDIGLSKGPPHQ
jgi:hypothetical protein